MAGQGQGQRVHNAWGEGERLRQEILDAATRILEETGGENALSLRGVAREVGIAAPSIYLHFKDKSELRWAVLALAYRQLAAAMRESGDAATAAGADPRERLYAIVAAYRRFAIDKPPRYRLMFSLESQPGDGPAPDDPFGTVRQAWTDAVDEYLAAIHPERRAEAEILGIHLWTAIHGQLALWRSLPGPQGETVLIELEQSLLRRLLPWPNRGGTRDADPHQVTAVGEPAEDGVAPASPLLE